MIIKTKPTVFCFLLLGLCIFVLAATGCGKKGDPEPKDPQKAFAWKEVSMSSVNYCLNFSGTLDGAYGNLDYIRLDLAAVDGPEDCPGCPFVPGETHTMSPEQVQFNSKAGTVNFTYCPLRAQAYRWQVSGVNVYRSLPHAVTQEGLLVLMP